MEILVCNKCGAEKTTEAFYKHATNLSGVSGSCKDCHNRKSRENPKNKEYQRTYRLKHRENMWRHRNPEKDAERKRVYQKLRRKQDLGFRILGNLRNRIWQVLKRNSKASQTRELIGCSIPELKNWIGSQMQPGMSWENYGAWHIDHRKPCSSFDLTKPEEQKICFNYRNLQPLWAIDNLRKSDKVNAF